MKGFGGGERDTHLLPNLDGGGEVEVNAFQRQATVILQKSLREGFGLTVAEGLWKAKPVIGGHAGGIPLQIQDGETGYLVESVEQCSARVLEALASPDHARMLGERGRQVVRQRFLSTANLRNYLRLVHRPAESRAPGPQHAPGVKVEADWLATAPLALHR